MKRFMLWGDVRWLNRRDEINFSPIPKEKALFTMADSEGVARKNFQTRILLSIKERSPRNYPLRHHDIVLDYANLVAL